MGVTPEKHTNYTCFGPKKHLLEFRQKQHSLENAGDVERVTVPIPINLSTAEIGAVQATLLEKKFKAWTGNDKGFFSFNVPR